MTHPDRSRTGPFPPHPAHLDLYLEVLGPELAVRLFMNLGGLTIALAREPRGRSRAEEILGRDRFRELGSRVYAERVRIPLPKHWLAQVLSKTYGYSLPKIVTALKASDVTVWRWLSEPAVARLMPKPADDEEEDDDPDLPEGPAQLRLF